MIPLNDYDQVVKYEPFYELHTEVLPDYLLDVGGDVSGVAMIL